MTFKPEVDVIEFNISVSVTNDNMRWAAVGFSTDGDMVTVLSLLQIDLIFQWSCRIVCDEIIVY